MNEQIHIQSLGIEEDIPLPCRGEGNQGLSNGGMHTTGYSRAGINLSYNAVWKEPEKDSNADNWLEHLNPDWSFMSGAHISAAEYEEPPLPIYSPFKDYQRAFLDGECDDSVPMPMLVPQKENVYPSQSHPKLVSLRVTCDRKASIVTAVCDTVGYEGSLGGSATGNACCRVGLKTETTCQPQPMPEAIHSVKISIGHFNSVERTQSVPTPLAWKQEGHKGEEGKSSSEKHCCSCKKSRCLKLYCECFANGGYCHGCNCVDCHNRPQCQEEIRRAKQAIGEKNPVAFKRRMCEDAEERPPISCNCSKSGCLKKYCECYKNGLKCGSSCNCLSCANTTALRTISYRRYEKKLHKTLKPHHP